MKAFILENVTGIMKKIPGMKFSSLDLILQKLRRACGRDWYIEVYKVNSRNFALAQNRWRIYIAGVSRAIMIFPLPTMLYDLPYQANLLGFLKDFPNIRTQYLPPKQKENLIEVKKVYKKELKDPNRRGEVLCFDLCRTWGFNTVCP